MSDIFLSYASEDRERVRPLTEALTAEGWSVFWDRIIPVGKTWDQVLEKELEAACSVVIVWSNNSIKSRWVKIEGNEGLRKELPFFPILLDAGVLPPLQFRDIQAADFTKWDGMPASPAFQSLIQEIKKVLCLPAAAETLKPPPVEPATTEIKPTELPPAAKEEPEVILSEPEPTDITPAEVEHTDTTRVENEPSELAGPVAPKEAVTESIPSEVRPEAIPEEEKYGYLWVDTEPSDSIVEIRAKEREPHDVPDFTQGIRLEPDNYLIKVSADGYQDTWWKIELKAGEIKHISIKLRPGLLARFSKVLKRD